MLNDLSKWLTTAETCVALGMSPRTLQRLTAAGKGPECRERPRWGKKAEPVYNPKDVAELRAASAARPPVALPPEVDLPETSTELSIPGQMPPQMALALELVERVSKAMRPDAGKTLKPWLTIKEAAEYTGLSQAYLRRLISEGKLSAVKDGAWKTRRKDLNAIETERE